MKAVLQILGCGTSTGVPIPGCQCRICLSDNPRNKRSRTSAIVKSEEGSHILIDTSTDLRWQSLKWGIRKIDAVLYTHSHADHVLGLDDLRAFNFVQRAQIPCFGTQETIEEIQRIFFYVFQEKPDYQGGMLPQITLSAFRHFEALNTAGIHSIPFPLLHGNMIVSGFRFGNLAYATDCKAIPAKSAELLRGVRYLVLDGLRFQENKVHMTIPEAIASAKEIGAEQTFLIHMTHDVDYDEVSAVLPKGVQLAYDGLEIEFENYCLDKAFSN